MYPQTPFQFLDRILKKQKNITHLIYICWTNEAFVWPIWISAWTPFTKHVHVLHFLTKICLTKQNLCFTNQGIGYYKTEPKRASNKALVYVHLSLYAVRFVQMAPNGSQKLQMAPNGPKWLLKALNCLKWHEIAPDSY